MQPPSFPGRRVAHPQFYNWVLLAGLELQLRRVVARTRAHRCPRVAQATLDDRADSVESLGNVLLTDKGGQFAGIISCLRISLPQLRNVAAKPAGELYAGGPITGSFPPKDRLEFPRRPLVYT